MYVVYTVLLCTAFTFLSALQWDCLHYNSLSRSCCAHTGGVTMQRLCQLCLKQKLQLCTYVARDLNTENHVAYSIQHIKSRQLFILSDKRKKTTQLCKSLLLSSPQTPEQMHFKKILRYSAKHEELVFQKCKPHFSSQLLMKGWIITLLYIYHIFILPFASIELPEFK